MKKRTLPTAPILLSYSDLYGAYNEDVRKNLDERVVREIDQNDRNLEILNAERICLYNWICNEMECQEQERQLQVKRNKLITDTMFESIVIVSLISMAFHVFDMDTLSTVILIQVCLIALLIRALFKRSKIEGNSNEEKG